MASAIDQKYSALKAGGLDLGAPTGGETDAGFGGRVQVYTGGRIYWHASTGAHEVHGAILETYLRLGGPGAGRSGARHFGFPTADEGPSKDHGARISTFEWGAVLWGFGADAVPLYGPFYGEWMSHAGELGFPLTEALDAPAEQKVVFFECGCLFTAGPRGEVQRLRYTGPMMGNPSIASPREPTSMTLFSATRELVASSVSKAALDWIAQAAPNYLTDIWKDRFALQPVGSQTVRIPLQLRATAVATAGLFTTVQIAATIPPGLLADRTLHDLVVVKPGGNSAVMRPHMLTPNRTGAVSAPCTRRISMSRHAWTATMSRSVRLVARKARRPTTISTIRSATSSVTPTTCTTSARST